MAVKILINNQETETSADCIKQLAVELELPERGVALAVNNHIVPRSNWEETRLKTGDNVTIIKAAFGG